MTESPSKQNGLPLTKAGPSNLATAILTEQVCRTFALFLLDRHAAAKEIKGSVSPNEEPASQRILVIGVTGSVAVGKSRFAKDLAESLSEAEPDIEAAVISTDGFLLPAKELRERGLLNRKGFPESYDRDAMSRFMKDVRSAERGLQVFLSIVRQTMTFADRLR